MGIKSDFIVQVANESHIKFSQTIVDEMEASAKVRGTGIAKRSPEYIREKIEERKAVIALTKDGRWAGFCYIETWSHERYVSNSGLIVSPEFRKSGLARRIKEMIFYLSRKKYPDAKIFGLTTGLAVMKINSDLGYEPVTFSELTDEEAFWNTCQSCVNYDILKSKNCKNCLCTAMLFDPKEKGKYRNRRTTRRFMNFARNSKLMERWIRFKQNILLRNQYNSAGADKKTNHK
jgi:hypothetical protein